MDVVRTQSTEHNRHEANQVEQEQSSTRNRIGPLLPLACFPRGLATMKKRPAAQMSAAAVEDRQSFRVARASSRWDVSAMPSTGIFNVSDSDDADDAVSSLNSTADDGVIDFLRKRQLARAEHPEAGCRLVAEIRMHGAACLVSCHNP